MTAWVVTSGLVVGSSRISSCGSVLIAIAIRTRCCMPPLIWWGKRWLLWVCQVYLFEPI
jgi:hypothetical protein